MKECPASFLGGQYSCNGLDGENCLKLRNDGVPDGEMANLLDRLRGLDPQKLARLSTSVNSGRGTYSRCIARQTITAAILQVLQEKNQ